MRYCSSTTMRALDRLAIESLGIAGIELMERAGAGAARAALQLAGGLPRPVTFTVLAGGGNNGADGLIAARRLHTAGQTVRVWLTRPPENLHGDAATAFARMQAAGVDWKTLSDPSDWETPAMRHPPDGVCLDALLGTGASGAPRGTIAAAIDWLRRAAGRARILALDMPSGLDADRGNIPGESPRADLTLTFGHPKPAMRRADRRASFGRIEVLDIGLPPLPPNWAEGDDELIAAPDWAERPPRRPAEAHKGDFGHLLVAGGSRGFGGAPLLCALAALRTGAGRVSLVVPQPSIASAAGALAPEIMTHVLPKSRDGDWSEASWGRWKHAGDAFDVVVAGPGMGISDAVRARIVNLAATHRALVLDADGLNVWRGEAQALRAFGAKLVLTPHPAEAARLLGCDTADVQRDRSAAARRLADAAGAVVVLKGAGTLVCAPGTAPHLNPTGNPGMATAGAGDVLCGVIGALIGQGLNRFDAARLGVYLHGTAGDLAAWRGGQAALIARDLISRLGEAWLTLQPR